MLGVNEDESESDIEEEELNNFVAFAGIAEFESESEIDDETEQE